MVMRKHIGGGRILDIVQPDFERIVELTIESLNEMGDRTIKTLVIEIMGKHSNIILLNESGKVLDAIKHIPPGLSSVRMIMPGTPYSRPPAQDKASPLEAVEIDFFIRQLSLLEGSTRKIQQSLYQRFNGISPIFASEICARAGIPPSTYAGDLSDDAYERLYEAFSNVFTQITKGDFNFQIYYNDAGKAVDLSAFTLELYSSKKDLAGYDANQQNLTSRKFDSSSVMLETFYARRDADYRTAQKNSRFA
jgi:predicted ribosome quality control (RQC) complex YloA/Tae2 family protein